MRIPLSLIQSFISLDLPPAQIGQTLTLLGIEVDKIFDEADNPVFELSLTPNLGHCMSALGIARELGAALQRKVHRQKPHLKETGTKGWEKSWTVTTSDACPLYLCRLIEGVKIGPSPLWLQKELIASGMRPICNAVDIANYILLKVGQPLHIFDADQIQGKTLQVALSQTDQTFQGLDEIEREIPRETLLISDATGPVAIAGILGGARSSTTPQTKNILIEAAFFDPAIIRKGTKKLNLRTESSQRFEKGIDPDGVALALDEALALLLECCGGKLACGTLEKRGTPFPPKQIRCRPERVNQILGTHLSLTEMEEIFSRLQFSVKEKGDALEVDVPLFRSDVTEEIDLIEEIARIYGYNQIAKGRGRFTSSSIPHDSAYLFETEARKRLLSLGLQEFLTSDLISPKLATMTQEWAYPDIQLLSALKPKTEEYSILRPSLLPGLMEVAAKNFGVRNQSFRAFEIGRVHFLQKDQLVEQPMGAILLTGKEVPSHWSKKGEEVDFFDLKGLVEALLEALHIPPCSFQPAEHPSFQPGRGANLLYDDQLLGSLGQIHPRLLSGLDIKQKLFYAEINLHHLMEIQRTLFRMSPIPKFPSSERDWTVSLPNELPIQKIVSAIQTTDAPLLEKVELIDLYMNGNEKRASFRFTYRGSAKTLSFEEVEKAHAELLDKISCK